QDERERVLDPLVEHLTLPVPTGLGIVQCEREPLAGLRVDTLHVIEQSARMLHRRGALVQPLRVLLLERFEHRRIDCFERARHLLSPWTRVLRRKRLSHAKTLGTFAGTSSSSPLSAQKTAVKID